MLYCKEVTELCSDEMDRHLRFAERVAMRSHLMMCAGCTNYRKHMKTLRQFARTYSDGQAISSDDRPDPQG